jgi:hypothetical protein
MDIAIGLPNMVPGVDGKSLTEFARLGPDAEAHARQDLEHYYGWLGDELASMIAAGASTSEDQVRSTVQAFDDVGCDELVMFPTSADPAQADMLADAVGLGG